MKKLFTLIVSATLFYTGSFAQTNVGINTSTPDASAALDVSSTSQGMLIPRMTQAQRDGIATPASGLLIYQTDNTPGFYYFNGTIWTTFNGSNGQGFANGTAGGQVYLTGASSPFAPQTPVTLTGDVTVSDAGVTTITNNAVTTPKLADGAVTIPKIGATGTPSATTFLRGDGTWSSIENTTSYAAAKASGFSLINLDVLVSGFRGMNFLASDRTVGLASLYSESDYSYTVPSTGVYQISYSFRYGSGIQASVLSGGQGTAVALTRSGSTTIIESSAFNGLSLGVVALTISSSSINVLYELQAGDKITFGLTGGSLLTAGLASTSKGNFFITKVN